MNKSFNRLLREARKTVAYKEETIYLRFLEQIYKRMQSCKMSRVTLATKLDMPPLKLNGLLNGILPLDIHSMLLICKELNITMSVRLYPLNKKENLCQKQ